MRQTHSLLISLFVIVGSACGNGIDKKNGPSSNASPNNVATNASSNNVASNGAPNVAVNGSSNNRLPNGATNNGSANNGSNNNGATNNGSTNNGATNNGATNNASTNNTTGTDCTVAGCSGMTYCEPDSGECLPGCGSDDQCSGGRECTIDNACECPEGTHVCGDGCAPDDSIDSCGTSCDPCPTDPSGSASCNFDGMCELTCDAGYRECASGCCEWNVEVLRTMETWSLDAEIDANDVLHVTMADYVNYDLLYATETANGWTTVTVDSSGSVGFGSDLELDAAGDPHIIYRRAATGYRYATFDGTWQTETAQAGSAWGGSLELDGSLPRMTFYDATYDDLMIANRAPNGTWSTETIDSTDAGGDTAFLVDSSGTPHVFYQDTATEDLLYATRVNGSWQSVTVDSQGDVGMEISVALDSGGYPHIAYLDLTALNDASAKYAYLDATGWHVEFIDTDHAGEFVSLALDSQDRPHVAYRSLRNYSLEYAYREGGQWVIETVDVGDAGWYADIVIDSNDAPHIIHQDLMADEVRHVW